MIAQDFHTIGWVVKSEAHLREFVTFWIDRSQWFEVEPRPDDEWLVTVKVENTSMGCEFLNDLYTPGFVDMPIDADPGATVYLTFPQSGTYFNQKQLRDLGMPEGAEYTVACTEIHNSHTILYLREFPGKRFNTVNFGVKR